MIDYLLFIQRETWKLLTIIIIFLNILSPSLPIPVPLRNAIKTLAVGFGIGNIRHYFDPQNPIGEIAVVKGEREIGIGARSDCPTAG